jgi:hypothetical protein
MHDLWKEELTEEETERLLAKAEQEIRKRKLEVPAILFLESHKPLMYLGSQAAIVFAPMLVPFLGFDNVNDYSRLLSNRQNIETLIERLETEREPEEDAKKADPDKEDGG